jgi:hypothetical protein
VAKFNQNNIKMNSDLKFDLSDLSISKKRNPIKAHIIKEQITFSPQKDHSKKKKRYSKITLCKETPTSKKKSVEFKNKSILFTRGKNMKSYV